MTANSDFEKWATSYSGCDGGDIGSPQRQAIWLCGIEWGGTAQRIQASMRSSDLRPPEGYENASDNLAYIFNRQAMKLLSAIDGSKVSGYQDFCEHTKPFTKGSSGYFKMNLYPIAFKDTNHARWHANFAEMTGFEEKNNYIEWCRKHRFPQMRRWASTYRPKLIICLGKGYRDDFKLAFHDAAVSFSHKPVAGRDLWWSVNAESSLVVIMPFMVNRHGVTKNADIQQFGEAIAQLMEQRGCR